MEISPHDISSRSEKSWKAIYLQFQQQWEDRLNELKVDLVQRPFAWLTIAFIAGVVAQTFPVRILFLVVLRLVSWLTIPVILLLGVIKISDLFCGCSPRNAKTMGPLD
jgi:hypothetical protein